MTTNTMKRRIRRSKMSIYQEKFAKTLDWLIAAVVEKIEGRLPTKQETFEHVLIKRKGSSVHVFWKNRLIIQATIRETQNTLQGSFDVIDKYVDDFILER